MTSADRELSQAWRERDSWAALASVLAAENIALREVASIEHNYAQPAAEIVKEWADSVGWCPLHCQLVDTAHRCRDYDGYSILYTHGPIERVLDLYSRGAFERGQPGVPGILG